MSYDNVAKNLASSIGCRVIAYDNMPEHGGCILYLDSPIRRINIETGALEGGLQEVALFIRELIQLSTETVASVGVGMRNGALATV